MADPKALEAFISAWSKTGGSELANTQSFINELCSLIGVEAPKGSRADDSQNDYVFERSVFEDNGDGTYDFGRIDCYKRSSFVLEAKQGTEGDRRAAVSGQEDLDLFGQTAAARVKRGTAKRGTPGWAKAMTQAERYAKALPIAHGWPPFLLVTDVGYCIEIYADFSGTGKAYTQFPDRARYRVMLEDLRDAKVRERLAAIWDRPLSLDPSTETTRVTREIGDLIAVLARGLEKRGHPPDKTSAFLMRLLFTMFAEDSGLLPKGSFTIMLQRQRERPELLKNQLETLWEKMDRGGFAGSLGQAGENVRRFNGYLFKDTEALDLEGEELEALIKAAGYEWTQVEPAIFGTLLERALDPKERAKLGAHYTPRASVERLVLPAIIEPLRAEWLGVQTAAVDLLDQGKRDNAQEEVEKFHSKLARTRVLDPACGTGNFLYVAMARMKELEAEVIDLLVELDDRQYVLEITGHTITPENFLGIEVNPRAAAIAQLVIWIGYLQWHFRTVGPGQMPVEPILRDITTIDARDALISWRERRPLKKDGKPVTLWDGTTMKQHPITGQLVPDESAQAEVYEYKSVRAAEWPEVDFIVGNPPFIGNKRMRKRLGTPYTQAIRSAYPEVSQRVDLVMYWWNRAARLVAAGKARRSGFITTKSITQSSARPVLSALMQRERDPVSIVFAVPNHPWHDPETTAAVRIAMTVVAKGRLPGTLSVVVNERRVGRETEFELASAIGTIQVDLSIGAEVASAKRLKANLGLSWMGVKMGAEGFRVRPPMRAALMKSGFPAERLPLVIGGSDVIDPPSEYYAIDCAGLTEEQLQTEFPTAYQYLNDHVRPMRHQNDPETNPGEWWRFIRPRPKLARSVQSLRRFIVTSETSKYRIFRFVSREGVLIDGSVIAIASEDAFDLGVLSSRIHTTWAIRAGGRMGAGNDPRYQNEVCFDPFPFPSDVPPALKERIRSEAEALDSLHSRVLADHKDLTLSDVYNVIEVLELVRAGTRALSEAERDVYERGLVSMIEQRLRTINALVASAYDLDAEMPAEDILTALVELNRKRIAEETAGLIRYLRPALQAPAYAAPAPQLLDLRVAASERQLIPWPSNLAEQVTAVANVLSASTLPLRASDVAHAFKGKRSGTVVPVLEALAAMGQVRKLRDGRYAP